MNASNICEDCPDYQTPSGDQSSCVIPTCDGAAKYIKTDGTCDTCTNGKVPDSTRKICKQEA